MYTARDYSALTGIEGFSDTLLKNHFTLYQGYVNNTNKLADTLKAMLEEGKTATPEYAELKRRFGFEFDGMRLHEYYFSNLGKSVPLSETGKFYQALAAEFGSYQLWEADFKATSAMRGIGWVILYKDPQTGRLFNQWINEHEAGHLAGATPILVIDVFEHAFLTDYGLKRAEYIAAFIKNINWSEVEKRFLI
ncbi:MULTISPECIES: superoxide dismutase [Dehalococcoides]|jgi:Fe-Mn family superoxide dismutase|uniref:superoxide dismutase n=2 Tax=Dehalococcoides mccartyi TaxID=61435 RepID=A0A142VBM8_9CHLR|nr:MULTISPECIES: superoxide dismutase [Dehalococcoides]AGG06501.1 iron/manganese superoxide dismutase [Dehalococcoides mccartyi DCMB5]AGG07940.1 iron/manganese superoxide dismutase [Dehalococcoides mccartyi BTF08]AII61011.1 superoxide dismutase [Dehalococcoides mccartyi CG5]AMU86635.1 superoxide dismutase, Fe-Mn family [Dehalococcoides mccartyi]AQU05941.1 superoxide dismutase [Dehalococcoides mccartyi]